MKSFIEFITEEQEVITEISKRTLNSYIEKAGTQTASTNRLVPAFRMRRAAGMYKAWKLLNPAPDSGKKTHPRKPRAGRKLTFGT